MLEELKEIRDQLYSVNANNISLRMIGMKHRDDELVYATNECLGYIIKALDTLIQKQEKQHENQRRTPSSRTESQTLQR